MFAKKELDYEVEVAFRSAKDVLDYLGIQSPQASHYSEILGLLSNAIMKRRMELSSRPRSRYVGKLLSLNREADIGQGDGAANEEALAPDGYASGTSITTRDIDEVWGAEISNQTAELDGDVLRGWDGLELSQWDSFPFFNPRVFGF